MYIHMYIHSITSFSFISGAKHCSTEQISHTSLIKVLNAYGTLSSSIHVWIPQRNQSIILIS